MKFTTVLSLSVGASAHGIIRSIEGANGVTMPGLGVADGTPRDCFSNTCGSQADTSIIRDHEMESGKYGALGWNQGHGNISPETVLGVFMGEHNDIPKNYGKSGSVGQEDKIPMALTTSQGRMAQHKRNVEQLRSKRQDFLGNVFKTIANLPVIGFASLGGTPKYYPTETMLKDTAGAGASQGLPTPDENGIVSMVYRQVNQDGAGPLSAAIDYTSGGKDYQAFQGANVVTNAPGLGLLGLGVAVNTDYVIRVQTDKNKQCTGQVGNSTNVCIVRVRNGGNAGPFGGSAAFTNAQ